MIWFKVIKCYKYVFLGIADSISDKLGLFLIEDTICLRVTEIGLHSMIFSPQRYACIRSIYHKIIREWQVVHCMMWLATCLMWETGTRLWILMRRARQWCLPLNLMRYSDRTVNIFTYLQNWCWNRVTLCGCRSGVCRIGPLAGGPAIRHSTVQWYRGLSRKNCSIKVSISAHNILLLLPVVF